MHLQPGASYMHLACASGMRQSSFASVQGSELGFSLPHASIQVIMPSASLLKYGSTVPSSLRTYMAISHFDLEGFCVHRDNHSMFPESLQQANSQHKLQCKGW